MKIGNWARRRRAFAVVPPTPPLRQRCVLPPLPGGEARMYRCGFGLYKAGRPRLAGRRLAGSACGLARTPPPTPPLRQRCALPPLPRGEASSHQCRCRWEYALAPPLGELSPQVTERGEHGNVAAHNHRENECRGRPPDVPQGIIKVSLCYLAPPLGELSPQVTERAKNMDYIPLNGQ